MDRKAYLWALEQALTGLVPARERAEMLRYYEEYFDDAGPEGEASVIESLGDPRELAKKLAAEAGYHAPAAGGVPPKKRRVWPWVVLGVAAVLVVLALAIGWLAANFAVVLGSGFDRTPGTSQSVEQIDPGRISDASDDAPLLVDGDGQTAVYGKTFTSVDVEVPLADVTVIVGENYGVELVWDADSKYSLSYTISRGELKVTGSPKTIGGMTVEGASAVITVPAGTRLGEINVETGLGDIRLSGIQVRDVDCGTGLGDVTLEQVDASEITVGTGMGSVVWTGALAADMELSSGMGDVEIITGSADGWDMELTTAMGRVTVNGRDEDTSYRQRGSAGELEASSGMGDITLKLTGDE